MCTSVEDSEVLVQIQDRPAECHALIGIPFGLVIECLRFPIPHSNQPHFFPCYNS